VARKRPQWRFTSASRVNTETREWLANWSKSSVEAFASWHGELKNSVKVINKLAETTSTSISRVLDVNQGRCRAETNLWP